jgi:hypothetical protein
MVLKKHTGQNGAPLGTAAGRRSRVNIFYFTIEEGVFQRIYKSLGRKKKKNAIYIANSGPK